MPSLGLYVSENYLKYVLCHYVFNNRSQAKISAPTRVHLEKKKVQSSGEVQADDEIQ